MKTKILLMMGFLAVLTGVAMLAYAAGVRAPWLTTQQMQFTTFQSSLHQNQLKPDVMWDAMMNQLTVWAKNHEQRLQVRAQSSAQYPNLTDAQTSFLHLKQTRESNGNQLTAKMWDDLAAQLTLVVSNHEQRLRMEPQTPQLPQPGTAALLIENPMDMMFEGNKFGTDHARELKVKFVNLDGDKTKLRYRPQDRNIVAPYGGDNVSDIVPLKNGVTSICVSYSHGGYNLQTCTPAVVGDPGSTQSSQPSQPQPPVNWFSRCAVGTPFTMPQVGKGSEEASITLTQRNISPSRYTLNYTIKVQPSSKHRNPSGGLKVTPSRSFSVPGCMGGLTDVPQKLVDAFNSSLRGSVYRAENIGAGMIKIEQTANDSTPFTRSGSIPL